MNPLPDSRRPHVPFLDMIDLASERVGGQALATNDDFFAPKENLLRADPAIFIPGKFTEFGKWMDGWESRRKRNVAPGNDHDWCVIRLGIPGIVRGLNVDTAFFVGNFPESCSVDACDIGDAVPVSETKWTEILPKSRLQGGVENLFPISDERRWTHLRLRIFPDGGVARFRVHGEVAPDVTKLRDAGAAVDLIAATNGGSVVACSDMFFGPKENLILPGRAPTMGNGWETRRKRGPVTADWIVIKPGLAGRITKIEIDTNHFKGNFPESARLEGCRHTGAKLVASDFRDRTDLVWEEILPRTKLEGHTQHFFDKELGAGARAAPYDYIRLSIFPDGGISRLRIHGVPVG